MEEKNQNVNKKNNLFSAKKLIILKNIQYFV